MTTTKTRFECWQTSVGQKWMRECHFLPVTGIWNKFHYKQIAQIQVNLIPNLFNQDTVILNEYISNVFLNDSGIHGIR